MKQVCTRLGLGLLIAAIVLGFGARNEIIASFSKPVDIYVDYPEKIDDVKAIDTELYQIIDTFAEEEITSNGSVTSVYYYYIVPVFTADEDEAYYVGLKVNKNKSAAYDRVVDSTWDAIEKGTDLNAFVEFTGCYEKMDKELYGYFLEYFEDVFDSEEEMKKYVLPLVMEPMVIKNSRTTLYVVIGMFVAGAVLLFLAFRKPKQAPASRPYITVNGINYPSSNFESVNKMVKKGETANAVKELQRLTGVEPEVAASVVSNWTQHWGN